MCAIERVLDADTNKIMEVIPIAGSLENHGGTAFDFDLTRLKTSDSNADSKKEGLRLVLKGGKHKNREQRAVIEFLCDRNQTGTEGEWESEDKYETESKRKRDDAEEEEEEKGEEDKEEKDEGDDKDDKEDGDKEDDKDKDDNDHPDEAEHQLKKDDAALIWEGYGDEKGADILRLTWHTKYACEKRDDDKDVEDPEEPSKGGSSGWGFFTWLLVM